MTKLFKHDLDVVGLKFRMKRDVRKMFASWVESATKNGRDVKLIREEDNKFDPNAIRVDLAGTPPSFLDKKHIGYIRADSAALIAPLMDTAKTRDPGGLTFKSAKLYAVVGEDLTEGRLHVVFTDTRKK